MAISKIRTAEELKNSDLNYFIAFDIAPTETNTKKITDALIAKRNTFARNVNPITARLNELKEDIDQTMLNDAVCSQDANGSYVYTPSSGGRKKEAERAKEFYKKRAINMASTLCKSGYIEDTKIDEIAKRFYITAQDILDGIKTLLDGGVILKKIARVKREVAFSNFKKMEAYLKTIAKKDLYDFSELPDNTPLDQLFKKQEEIYNISSKKANDAKAKASQDLSGIGKVVFKSEAAKREYDIYLKCKVKVWDNLSTLYDSGVRAINDKFFTECLDAMRSCAGLGAEAAEKELYAYMENFKITREGADKIKIAVCPYDDCGKSYVWREGLKNCPVCGRPLEIKCWNCGEIMSLADGNNACPKCGATVGNRGEFDVAQKQFAFLLKNPASSEMDLIGAINAMENVYPEYEKFPESVVCKALSAAKVQLDEHKKKIAAANALYDKYVKEIGVQIAKKCFYKADELLSKLKVEDPTFDTKEFENKISAAIKSAKQFVDSAAVALKSGKEEAAVENCGKALEICADCVSAKQVLKSYPPKSPKNLKVRVIKNSVKLDWMTDGNQNAVTYSVIRKAGSPPADERDGEIIDEELSVNFSEDASVSPATPYYYGVFAVRGEVASSVARSEEPAAVFPDVKAVRQEKISGAIKASWTQPDNVKCVEVYKKAGSVPPSSPQDGTKIETDGLKGFTDRAAGEDKCSYLVVCKYDYDGGERVSCGVRATYKAFSIPEELKNVRLSGGGSVDFVLDSDMPSGGAINLYSCDNYTEFAFGEADEKSAFAKKCRDLKPLDSVSVAENKLRFYIPEGKILWLYPVVENEQLYAVSKPLLINTVQGVKNLNVVQKNGSITIEGTIAPSVRNVIAIINNQKFAQSIDDQGEKRTCSAAEFNDNKGFYIALRPGVYYITLFAEFIEGGKKLYSGATCLPEVIDNREKTAVKYCLDFKPSVTSSYKVKLDFYSDQPIELPPVDIVSGFPKPLNKNSGAVIGTFRGGELKKKLFKQGYYLSGQVIVSSAKSMKDRLVLFFTSDSEKHIQLKEVQKI